MNLKNNILLFKMFLVFDTETSGLPKKYNLPAEYVDNWPRIVQLSWGIYDNDGKEIKFYDYIIKPEGFTIDPDSTKIHRITTEIALEKGRDIKEILLKFKKSLKKVDYIAAHNYDFDINIVGAECIRNNINLRMKMIKKEICTMKSTTEYCKLPNPKFNGLKWPRLQELHLILFGEDFTNAHNSKYDVIACSKCLFECIRRKIIIL